MSKKHLVTWDILQVHARELALRLLPAEQWKGIIAVSRGGLVPAAIIARELNIRHVDTLCLASYHNYSDRGDIQIIKKADIANGGAQHIIIDDLVDTGNTAKIIRELYPNAHFVTIFAKPAGKSFVNDYILDIPQDTWIEQPWDTGVQFIDPIIKQKNPVASS